MAQTTHQIAQWEATSSQHRTMVLHQGTLSLSILVTASLTAVIPTASQKSHSSSHQSKVFPTFQELRKSSAMSICFARSQRSITPTLKLWMWIKSSRTHQKQWRLTLTIRAKISWLNFRICCRTEMKKRPRRKMWTHKHFWDRAEEAMRIATAQLSLEFRGVRAQATGGRKNLLPQIRITQAFYSSLRAANRTLDHSIKRLPGAVLLGAGPRLQWTYPRRRLVAKSKAKLLKTAQ